jgi:hypothetical protein
MINWDLLTGGVRPGLSSAPAPVGLTLPTPQAIASQLDQSEWIQYDDMCKLASDLVKRKSDEHMRIGRTISRMLRGELYAAAEPHARNSTLYKIAGEVLEAFPFCSPDSVVDLFRISLERMAEETNVKFPGNPAPTLAEFRAMLVRHQGPKQGKHATITEALTALDAYQQTPAAPQPNPTLPTPDFKIADNWGAEPEIVAGPTAAELAGLDRRSLIVRVSDTSYLLRHPSAATYDLKVSSGNGLRVELQRRFVDAGLPLDLLDDKGAMLPNDDILRNYCMNAHAVVYDYSVSSTTFDQRSSLLRVGIAMGRLADLRVIEPEYNEAVELWLYTLAGGEDAALIDLYDWIASTDQQYINHPSTALVLQGPPSIGKTQFARGLAMTWGCSEPVDLAISLDRFNGALRSCPIWFADEAMPKDLDQATFRRLIQAQERQIEPKGQERYLLSGCSRNVFAVNDLRDIAISANGANQDSIRATAARLSIYEACPERVCVAALLAIAGGEQVAERLAIARHLRSIQRDEKPKAQRFYGARTSAANEDGSEKPSAATVHLLTGALQKFPLVANALAEYIS